MKKEEAKPKPFLKWAGGKSQLIKSIELSLPKELLQGKPFTYVEPFVGSGAVMFWILKKYNNIQRAIINDSNIKLMNVYHIIKFSPLKLIKVLSKIENEFYNLNTEVKKRNYFIDKRDIFNFNTPDIVTSAALFIFLNKTCFNGLYRVNSKNLFNVPFGRNKNPKICDNDTILADSAILRNVTIMKGDYSHTLSYADKHSFFYFDPPYKPLSKTSNFTSYSINNFNDTEQERLKAFCMKLNKLKACWLLSNSDNNYFDTLYKGFHIKRISASRSINSVSSKRGKIDELLISNYKWYA
jgi:DNA adenine methylase